MQNFRLIVYLFLHGCGLHYNVLSGLSVKQEIKGLMTNYIAIHYPGRKPVYLQIFEFIGATVSVLHEIKNFNIIYSPMRGRIKGLQLVVIPIQVTAWGDIHITLTTSWVILISPRKLSS